MGPRLRKLALTVHVTVSVAWLGSVAAFLVLALAGLRSRNEATVRAAYVAMDMIGWDIIVPLSFASLLTGILQGLGTTWGLFRHYWVIAKLMINVLSTALLLLHMRPVSRMSQWALAASGPVDDHARVRLQLVFDASIALVALLAATTLSVYKPRGLTAHGRRELKALRANAARVKEAS